jgi:hypothetical protein
MTLTALLQRDGIILDANLLLLYFAGRHDPDLIGRFTERLSRYNKDDFYQLAQFAHLFRHISTTPNVLTEVINLIDKRSGRYAGLLQTITTNIVLPNEVYMPSQTAVGGEVRHFQTFGLTDLVLCELAQTRYVVLTDDIALWSFMTGRGCAAINFSQLRDFIRQKR